MIEVLYKTMKQFFPSFNNWLNRIDDPRQHGYIKYSFGEISWIGILLFLLKIGSRRQINFQFNTEAFRDNLAMLSKARVTKVAHDGTINYLLAKIKPEQWGRLIVKMIKRLIRMRCLEKYRMFGHYLVAVDGSGLLTFKKRHCPHCLTKEKGGKILYYYHNVLEAKLVVAGGMAFSIATEFIENPDDKVKTQDCEPAAFHRLAKKLKGYFPQLKICLLLDALYANKRVFNLCRENKWKYLITFKKGSMPATYQEYLSLKKINPDSSGEHNREGLIQSYRWVNEIDYESDKLNVLECEEIKNEKTTKFVWLTNFGVDKTNFITLAKGGRLRWKIENEGFNMQKNGGYNLQHAYSEHPLALKNYYLLLQIAHIINQLMEKGSLIRSEIKKVFGSIRNIARLLLEQLRTSTFTENELKMFNSSRFQIRLADP